MLEKIREGSQGPWAVAIVGIIVLSFVFTGVGSYLGGSTGNALATVNGEEITAQALDNAYQNERARMESQFGEAISAMFADPESLSEFRSNILQRLINEKLIEQKAFELGLRVGDEEIKQAIIEMPEFQLMGQFDNDTYLSRLRQANLQPSEFRDIMRNQLTTQQLNAAVTGSSFALTNEASLLLGLQQQTRDVSILEVSTESFKADVELSDEEIQAYYNTNIVRFETQEQVKLAYVNLEVNDLKAQHTVSEEEALAYYEQNQARYQTEEERRVSHILVELGEDETVAQAQAQSILAELNAGADFAQLALEKSADVVSAENGGDLDFISRGMMEASFEEAAFALQSVNDISDVVRTDFGFHIITLTELKASVVTEFSEVQTEISDRLLTEKATDTFFEYQEQMAALAFEVPDTLEDLANAIDATVFETDFFERGRLPAAVDYPQIEGIAFSTELVDELVNSELLEINNEKVMVVRVVEHRPQRTLALDEVKEGIVAQLTQDKAQQLAMQWAQQVEVSLSNGEAVDELLTQQNITWQTFNALGRNASGIDAEANKVAFELALNDQGNTSVVSQSNGNVALVRLEAVNEASTLVDADVENLKGSFVAVSSRKEFDNFLTALRAESDIVITQ